MASYDPMDVDIEGDESEDYGQTPKPSDPTAARRWVPMPSGGKDRGYQQKRQESLVTISGRYQIGAMTSSRSGVSSVGLVAQPPVSSKEEFISKQLFLE